MNRLDKTLKHLALKKKKALVCFLTAGFPDIETTIETLRVLVDNGADIIELGVPFSDPIADGPTIQASSDDALRGGATLSAILKLVERARNETDVPILLMSYLNPLRSGGFEKTVIKAALSGVDGFIIPDMIPEEAREIKSICGAHGLSLIFLAAPNTPDTRLSLIDKFSQAFVYIVSLTGVTGGRTTLPSHIKEYLLRTKKYIHRPRFLGFGISKPEQVRQLKPYVDGFIVGSAIIELLRKHKNAAQRDRKVAQFIRSLRSSLDK